ncbi:hypothetical protein LDG_6483 [Legionella drancourtii LLAP12]|uniref:Uncharacterized protein n=1 Tax=Legionella drancourtii LLAP12 TaxID=658187 RepID=G9EML5_9GAMM|nr:hypothetical protein LDG_6483 [Legionella drancourtii LLAP12]
MINQHLIEHDDAPVFNMPLTNQKPKASGKREILYTDSEYVSDSKIVLNLKNLIQHSLLNKLNKYCFKNGVLTITFQEPLPHLNHQIQQMLQELMKKHHQQIKESEFSSVIFVGIGCFFNGVTV